MVNTIAAQERIPQNLWVRQSPCRARLEMIMPERVASSNSVVKKGGAYVVLALFALALSACAAGSSDAQQAAHSGGVSVFVLGFWHGLIAPVTLLVEAINEFATGALPWSPHMYQEGGGVVYDIGFFVGIIAGPSVLWTGSLRRR